MRNATRGSKKARHEKGTEFFYTKAGGLNISFSQASVENLAQGIISPAAIHKFKLVLVTHLLSKVSIEFLSVVVTVKPLLDQSFVVCKIINHENRRAIYMYSKMILLKERVGGVSTPLC